MLPNLKLKFLDLPSDILSCLQKEYLNRVEIEVNRYEYEHYEAWRNLMNTNQTYFQQKKYESSYYNLNEYYSYQFLINEEYRKKVLSKVKNPFEQISVTLLGTGTGGGGGDHSSASSSLPAEIDYSVLNGLHEVTVIPKGGEEVSISMLRSASILRLLRSGSFDANQVQWQLNQIHILDLSDSSIRDVAQFAYIEKLAFRGCIFLSDVSSLGNVHSLDVSCCYAISDVSRLGQVYRLNLCFCFRVKDVSMLGNVYDLNLSGCSSVSDVNSLSNVRILNISNFQGKDISGLVTVKKLIMKNCKNILDLNHLKNLESLDISNCTQMRIEGLAIIANQLRELIMTGVENIQDVSSFNNLRVLNVLRRVTFVKGLPYLHYLKDLTIDQEWMESFVSGARPTHHNLTLHSIKSFAHYSSSNVLALDISNVSRVTINITDFIQELMRLSFQDNVQYAQILGWNGLKSIHSFPHLVELTVANCNSLNHINFSSCLQLQICEILNCKALTSLTIEGVIANIKIRRCVVLQVIHVSSPIHSLKVFHCNSLNEIHVENNIHELTVITQTILPTLDGSRFIHSLRLEVVETHLER